MRANHALAWDGNIWDNVSSSSCIAIIIVREKKSKLSPVFYKTLSFIYVFFKILYLYFIKISKYIFNDFLLYENFYSISTILNF